MLGLKVKVVDKVSEIDVQVLLGRYQEYYEKYINDKNIYALLTTNNKKRKVKLINRADAVYHIACVSLNAGYIRRSLKYFSVFQDICQELWPQNE